MLTYGRDEPGLHSDGVLGTNEPTRGRDHVSDFPRSELDEEGSMCELDSSQEVVYGDYLTHGLIEFLPCTKVRL